MHEFNELMGRGTIFSLKALNEAQRHTVDELQKNSASSLVKALQMIELQKSILAVGLFSMFDASLQKQLQCRDGFKKADQILESQDEVILKEKFFNFRCAINVLKHGVGSSYDKLVEKAGTLPFRVKHLDEPLFNEGNVSEVQTLIEVGDEFILMCVEVIHAVSIAAQHDNY